MPHSARKAELRHALSERLVEKGVLPKSAAAEAESETEVEAPMVDAKVVEVAGVLAAGVEPDLTSETRGNMSTEDLRLALKIKEVESRNKEVELLMMHLRIRALQGQLEKRTPVTSTPVCVNQNAASPSAGFDRSRHTALVPPLHESEVDSYFSAFERVAATLNGPKEFWSLLLECKLVGKAQEVCASLSIEQSLDDETLKKNC